LHQHLEGIWVTATNEAFEQVAVDLVWTFQLVGCVSIGG
jgi:hypothetical protein